MMKTWNKHLFKVGSVLLALTLTLAACGGGGKQAADSKDPAKDSKVFELNVNNPAPSTGSHAKGIFEPWKKLVEEKTNGRVKVNLYHGAALGSSTTVLKDVKGGVYDVGVVWSPYEVDSEMFPVTIADLPFAVTGDVKTNNDIINQYAKKYQETMGKNVILMGVSAATPAYFISKKPITKFEDLKGKKIRAVGKNEAETIKAWGAVPVSVSVEELYDALQKGIIDIVNTSAGVAVDSHLSEVAPYLADVPYKAIQMLPIMNKAFYDKLPDDLKTLFKNELNPALVKFVLDTNINDANTAKQAFGKSVEGKGAISQISAEEVNLFKSNVKPVWDTWVENANKKSYKGEEMLNEYKDALKKAGGNLPF